MAFLTTQLLVHRRHLAATTLPSITTATTVASNSFHTSTPLHRPGWKPPRNPKIGITLEQLRMAARGSGRRLPICHAEQEKVMNSLEAAKYENHAIYKYIMEYDKCREDYFKNNKGKDKTMMRELNKYLVRGRK